MVKIISDAGSIVVPHNTYISPLVFRWYSDYNTSASCDRFEISELQLTSQLIHQKNRWDYKISTIKRLGDITLPNIRCCNNEKIVLGFSGGLDSVYQAIDLKERGYDVILYHLKNINSYENGQADKRCRDIANRLEMTYIESVIHKKQKHQQVPENPLKNELIMSLMIDYCIQEGISYISMGDDLNLTLNDSVSGINVTDAREITESFIKGIQSIINIQFIPIINSEKLDRIEKIIEYKLENNYYSCVQAGRLNNFFHNKSEHDYNIRLFDNNCGCNCRKCAMHNLLLHYGKVKEFPIDFINKCWGRMWNNGHSADYELFKPTLTEEERINNLFKY